MSTELTIILDTAPEAMTENCRHQIEIAARAIAVSLGICGVSKNFEARRSELIATADDFTAPPVTDEDQEEMLTAQRALAAFRIEVGKEEALMKGPLNAAKTKIIELVKTGLATVEAAEKKLQGYINFRQNKLLEERRAEEQRLAAEQKRLADQAAQAEREQQQAEEMRQRAALAEQQARDAATTAERQKAQQEAAALTQQAEALDADAYGKMLDAETAAIPAAVSAPAPQAREVADFALVGRTDSERKESLRRLLAAHPEFFTLEAKEETPRAFSLKLRIADLVDALNGRSSFAELKSAPGITISKKLTTLR